MLKAILGFGKKVGKGIATGNTQASLGLQSPYFPSAIVRIGRVLYLASGAWIGAIWYTGYVNQRTEPGSGPTLVLPGTRDVVAGVNRPGPQAKWASGVGSATGQANFIQKPGVGGGSNPFPGAVGGRLDQGFDLTSKVFRAPAQSVIVFSSPSVSGWRGGGVVAGRILSGPKKGRVWYMAEGIRPTVRVNQMVSQGTQVAIPTRNPYNGIVGSIEAGWANPAAPSQPLAQISANKPAVSWDFYNWIRSLGGPTATQTGLAGYP